MKALVLDNRLARILAVKAASLVARDAALSALSPVRYIDVPEPRIPGPRWLKVRNRSCGLCGTDVHLILMDMDPGCFPAGLPGIERKYLGHEAVGEVVEAGAEADGFAPGDRVALRIDWDSCFQMEIDPPCRQCAAGNYMLCENFGKRPLPRDTGGGFSPFMVVHRTQVFKIPDAVSEARAILLEPTAVAVHAVTQRRPRAGEKVLVVGAGTIGLLLIAVARALSPRAEITCLARYDYQERAASAVGAHRVVREERGLYRCFAEITGATYSRGYFGNEILLGGFDLIFDSVGSDRTFRNALRWARGGGDVVLVGVNFRPGKLDYSPIWNQELRVHGVNSHVGARPGETSFDQAARLLADPSFPADSLVTHRFPMDRYKDAVRAFLAKGRSGAIKIVLDHPG